MEATEPDKGTMSFRAHLVELRQRLLRAMLGVVVAFFVAWTYHIELYDWLSRPVREALANNNLFTIKALQITESIEVYMRISVVGGLFLASPWVFYQIWAFVAPGLLKKERRLITPVVTGSVACFVLGAAFCYLVVLPFMTDFLIKMTLDAPGMSLEPTLASTVSFSLLMLLAFGAVFELPLFLYVLASLGLVTPGGLLRFFRYWIVVSFVIGAVLTPTPDPINQTLMAGPLVVLYAVGMGIAWFVQRKPGERASGKTLASVAVVLVLLAAGGVALALRGAERDASDDIPADARQVVGLHINDLTKTLQRADDSISAAFGLGPFALVEALKLRPLADPVAMLVRWQDGVALLVQVRDAPAILKRLADRWQASIVASPSGPSIWLPIGPRGERWRGVAASKQVLWLGTDSALERLGAVRRGLTPALVDDPVLRDRLAALRAEGSLWSLAPTEAGIAEWLPGGALGQNVRVATAVVSGDKGELVVRFDCKGPETALSLRDRIESWVADTRRAQVRPEDGRVDELTNRTRELALLVARVSESGARAIPQGSRDHQVLLNAGNEALALARQLGTTKHANALVEGLGPLAMAVRPPAVSSARVETTRVVWSLNAPASVLLAMLVAPSTAGLAPEAVVPTEAAADTEKPAFAPRPKPASVPIFGGPAPSLRQPTAPPTFAPHQIPMPRLPVPTMPPTALPATPAASEAAPVQPTVAR
jgi:Tat protein translocase TatC